jgi:hypothetical protein
LASRRCLVRDQCLGSYVVFVPSVVNTVYDCRLCLILSLTYTATTRLCHIKMTMTVYERLLFDLLVPEMSFGECHGPECAQRPQRNIDDDDLYTYNTTISEAIRK